MNRCCARCSNPFIGCGHTDCRCHAREAALQALRDEQTKNRDQAAFNTTWGK